jgi:hypothetical protein
MFHTSNRMQADQLFRLNPRIWLAIGVATLVGLLSMLSRTYKAGYRTSAVVIELDTAWTEEQAPLQASSDYDDSDLSGGAVYSV